MRQRNYKDLLYSKIMLHELRELSSLEQLLSKVFSVTNSKSFRLAQIPSQQTA